MYTCAAGTSDVNFEYLTLQGLLRAWRAVIVALPEWMSGGAGSAAERGPTRILDWLFDSNRLDLGTAGLCLPMQSLRLVAHLSGAQQLTPCHYR